MVNKIHNGDCVSLTNQLEKESIHLSLFSPPYDLIRDYDNGNAFDNVELGKSIYEKTVDGGVAVVVIGDGTKDFAKSLTSFRLAVNWCDQAGWRLFECCIYKRHGNPGAWWSKRFRVDHEYILIFLKGRRPRYFSKEHLFVDCKHAGKGYTGTDRLTSGGTIPMKKGKVVANKKCRGTIWTYATSNSEGNALKLKHPATYPDLLARDIIKTFTKKGDVVLDPMCGSGTTCVIASKEKRKYVGFDISEDYIKIARQRLKIERGDVEWETSSNIEKNTSFL